MYFLRFTVFLQTGQTDNNVFTVSNELILCFHNFRNLRQIGIIFGKNPGFGPVQSGIEISGVRRPATDSFCVGPADHYLSESAGLVIFGGVIRSISVHSFSPNMNQFSKRPSDGLLSIFCAQ